MTKKRIMIWYWGRRGGGARYTLELTKALLNQNDIEVHVSLSTYNELYEAYIATGAKIHAVKTYRSPLSFGLSFFRLPFLLQSLKHYMDDNDITCVVSSMPHLWSLFVIPLLKQNERKFISTIHDPEPHVGDSISYPKALVRREIEIADHVICLSEFVATRLRDLYDCPRNKVSVCPHGMFVFGADFVGHNIRNANRPFRFLFFGRILPYKGLPLLLEAFKLLEREGLNVELNIAGNGDVEQYAALMGSPRIKADIRWIHENELPVIYGMSDAVVLPYIAASQSGVWADAMGFQKPCIVTPVAGLVEQISHGENGLVTTGITPEDLANAMRHIMQPELYKTLTENLRQLDHGKEWAVTAEKILLQARSS